MKIKISYRFYTDGDFSLINPEQFGCTGRNVPMEVGFMETFFDYIGSVTFENKEEWRCKCDAKTFLESLLCDGLHISYTHYWLIEDFYKIIEQLLQFINANESGETFQTLSGNYDGTAIAVEFINE